MITESQKKKIVSILQNIKGDDTYRARMAFRSLTPKEMKEQHGNSGKTRQEILNSYLERDNEIDDLILAVNNSK